MTRASRVAVCVVALTSVAFAAPIQRVEIGQIAWLAGCWEMVATQKTVEEQWMGPRGGTMIGTSRTFRSDSLVTYELVIVREQGGQLAYEAHPSGQATAVFLSRTVTDSMIVFENLEHDFPQRVGYERKGRDLVHAWVEGPHQGRVRRITFVYHRTPCPQ